MSPVNEIRNDIQLKNAYKAGCAGKIKHLSQLKAREVIERLRLKNLKGDPHLSEYLVEYPCSFCGFWHVGHARKYYKYVKIYPMLAALILQPIQHKPHQQMSPHWIS